MNRLPSWFKQPLPDIQVKTTLSLIKELNINTICVEGLCPNINSCFKDNSLTFLILGKNCTRGCRFCAVKKGGVFQNLEDEPKRIGQIVKRLNLDYVVITSVCRDDLADMGASYFKKTVKEIKEISKEIKVELLIPDFRGDVTLLKEIAECGAEVVAHNIELPFRIYKEIKPNSNYRISLSILSMIKELNPKLITKSSLILGLGEKEDDVYNTIRDLKNTRIDILTLGQYLSPSPDHFPVKEFLSLERFNSYKEFALEKGIPVVISGPLVRSSYMAKHLYYQIINSKLNG
jgi:lipoic acid synthetase